jgi:hypothetical protein
MSKKIPIPFRMGDVVIDKSTKREHIIHEATICQGSLSYSTNYSAWHSHDKFRLVREADQASLSQLFKEMKEEEDY